MSSFVITTKYQKYFWKPSNIVFQNGGSSGQSWACIKFDFIQLSLIYMHMLIRLHLNI